MAETAESSLLSESQDFQLIDCEESQKPVEEETQSKEDKNDATDISEKIDTIDNEKITEESETQETVTQSESIVKQDEISESSNEKKDDILSENDDEMDFIPSSQQTPVVSPLKKQLSPLAGAASQKRKAQTSDEPITKFQRTCSSEDALSSTRKKLETQDDIFDSNIEENDDVVAAEIIPESQDSVEGETVAESLEEVQQQLDETISQCTGDETKISTNSSPVKEKSSSPIEISKGKESPKKTCTDLETSENSSPIKEKALSSESTNAIKSPKKDNVVENIVSSEISKESEKDDSAIVETRDEVSKPEIHEESKIVGSKDKIDEETSALSQTRKSDNSGFNSTRMEIDSVDVASTQTNRSRMSIEVIYDKATAPPKRPRELVEIDEEGEKIILDSSQESCDKSMEKSNIEVNKTIETSYKTCHSKTSTDYKSIENSKDSSNELKSSYSLTNGSADSKKNDTDDTARIGSDLIDSASSGEIDAVSSPVKKVGNIPPTVKISEHAEIVSISDSEGDSFLAEERARNKLDLITSTNHENSNVKILTVEREINVLVKLNCLIHVDETTKEHVEKVLTSVHCEPTNSHLTSIRRRNSDTSACLADISGNDNKDTSPGSVTSNSQPYPLNPRLSLMSTVSSSSSSSSGSSLSAVLLAKNQFQLPRGPAKHAKKQTTEVATPEAKIHDESSDQIKKDWKNLNILEAAIINFANAELQAMDLHNGSTERVDNSLERIRSSTPEVEDSKETIVQAVTPKTTKRNRSTKRSRSKTATSSNGVAKTSPNASIDVAKNSPTPTSSTKGKLSPEVSTPSRQSSTTKEIPNDTGNALIGKEVFAKWSDNKYYPGTVTSKTKTKFKVNFYDGQNKLIIEDFIVPMPETLNIGLSVYATSSEDDYGSCGIITDVKRIKNKVVYVVETDEGEKINVETKNIFLTTDQVQVLREDTKLEIKSPPSTPKHLGKVTLDNVVDGKRRSKRIATPVSLTPKMKRVRGSLADKSADIAKPSASGVSTKTKSELNYETTSDSNCSMLEVPGSLGVQPEVISTSSEQEGKASTSRIKVKARSRKKSEAPEIVANLGPIPAKNSNLFEGMSFLLTCASLESLDRFQTETKDSNSDPGTELEEEWNKKPFVRDRLTAQLTAGGGTVYENFEDVPPEKYDNTKLIANVPNITKKSLLCLSVGIKAYNHNWVIRCCQENKIVNPSEEQLPAGWSLLKQNYVEMYDRRSQKPFQTIPFIFVIPMTPSDKEFCSFWQQICENAGGVVLLPDNPDDEFAEGTVVLTNRHCPSWIIEKTRYYNIPLISTTWVIQCLIEGGIVDYDGHPRFAYNYVKRPTASHISNLKSV